MSDTLPTAGVDRSRMGRRNRRRGKEVENEIVKLLRDAGVAAERISRVGYRGPDIQIADEYLAEVKLRKEGFRSLARWMLGVKILFLREQGSRTPLVVVDWDVFVKMMGGDDETALSSAVSPPDQA